jgi:hypothetical protein
MLRAQASIWGSSTSCLLAWVNRPITSAAVNVLNSAMVEPKYAEGLMRGRWK